MTRDQLAKMPEFQVLEEIAHSKRHPGKTLEIQQALVDLLAAFPSERRAPYQVPLAHERFGLPGWVEALGEEVCGC